MFDLENRCKPILKWAGGKSGVLDQMVPAFPAHFGRFIEPFFGGGAVFFSLAGKVPSILNDVNQELTSCYEVVRDHPNELMHELDILSALYSEEFYYQLRAQTSGQKIRNAARTIFLNKTGFNGLYRQNSKGGFNVPFGKRVACPKLYERANLLEVSDRLVLAQLCNKDFEEVLAEAGAGDFVYCDPPYEPLNTTSSFNAYHGSGFDFDDQKRLKSACEAAAKRGAAVALSNSVAPAILNLYSGLNPQKIRARRAINSKGSARGLVEEVLVLLS